MPMLDGSRRRHEIILLGAPLMPDSRGPGLPPQETFLPMRKRFSPRRCSQATGATLSRCVPLHFTRELTLEDLFCDATGGLAHRLLTGSVAAGALSACARWSREMGRSDADSGREFFRPPASVLPDGD